MLRLFGMISLFFFFNDTATTEIYTLSLYDALPISTSGSAKTTCTRSRPQIGETMASSPRSSVCRDRRRSEEHTSELQSPCNLVCRLLLEKKIQCLSSILQPSLHACEPHASARRTLH